MIEQVTAIPLLIDFVRPFSTPNLPREWALVVTKGDGCQWIRRRDHLSVILSGAIQADGRRWLHLSVARPTYLPTWEDLTWVKETWLGPDLYAVQVIPPKRRYVNRHRFCLHLFATLDDWPLPEFSGFVPTVAGRTL